MKKIAKFMSLVMCVSSIGSFSFTSANAQVWTKDSMTINEFDFNDKTESSSWFAGTGIFDSQKTGAAISCLGGETGYAYKKIDDEHGVSLAMSGGAGIKYNFNRSFDADGKAVSNTIKGRVHFSFDIYAIKGDNTSQAVLQVNNYAYTWDNLVIDLQPKNNKCKLPQNGGYGDIKDIAYESGMWYRVDLNMDAGDSATIVDVFINGKYQSTTKVPEALNSLWLTGKSLGSAATNRFVVDNLRVQTEVPLCGYENSIDFDEMEASTNLWAGASYSASDATGGVIIRNSDSGASYQVIDDKNDTSYAMAGGAAFKYIFNRTFDANNKAVEKAVTGKFRLSFDMYNKLNGTEKGRVLIQLNNSESYYDAGLVANIRYNESKYCSIKNGSFTWDYLSYEPEKWHNIDMIFDAGATSTKVELYIDDTYIGTKTYAFALKSVGFFPDGSNSKCYTAIDNVEVSTISDAKELSAAAVATAISENTESVSVKYTGTLDRSSVNDEPEISVTEYDKDTGLTREIKAYAEIDYTATKLNVYFDEKLNDNSEITITLPSALKGLFSEKIVTETVKVATKMSMDYSDNFEGYTNAAKMPRFSGREFSGAEGYLGGQALTSEYDQNTLFTLPESIVVDNTNTDYIISFDMKIPDASKYVQFYVSYNSGSAFQWKDGNVYKEWSDIGDFGKNQWHHYDLVFDFDKSENGSKRLYLYQDGVKYDTSFGLWGTLSYVKLFAEQGYPYHIDNFHARYRNEVEVTTNLEGVISPSIKEAYIRFDDAVKKSKLTEANIIIEDEYATEVEYSIKAVDAYGVTISFADGALENNKNYAVVISGIETCAGEKISGEENGEILFNFTTAEIFSVADVKIKNYASEVTSVSGWDNAAEYSVEITLESTRVDEQAVYAVIAGYKQSGEMVNVSIVPFNVSVSGVYSESMNATDMTGADIIKIFVVDGFENLSPLMTQARILN